MQFVTHEISGADGMVRGFFLSRSLAAPPASRTYFPGIDAVAILAKQFDSAADATAWLKVTAQQGGNAVAVKIESARWLIGAWIADISAST